MYKLLVVVLAYWAYTCSLFAADSTHVNIIFIRPNNQMGMSSRLKLTINDSLSVFLVNHSFSTLNVKPGNYLINEAKKKSKAPLKLETKAGKTYYVGAIIRYGYWEIVEIDSAKAVTLLPNKKLKNMQKPLLRPTNRLGISLEVGGGFDNIEIGKTDKDVPITFSYGGGAGIGIIYGMELNKRECPNLLRFV